MGTIRRIRRHQHALIFGAGLFGALAAGSAQAETVGFASPLVVSAPQFLPQDCFGALPLLPDVEAAFQRPFPSLPAEAVLVATRADIERLNAPRDDDVQQAATNASPIEARIMLIFARFDDGPAETYSAAPTRRSNDLAAHRWTPVVSQALVAWAYPTR